ncbi:MAG TPA: hypothetical protein VFH59_00955 [Frateuria sp.]|uniref:hypothetical protein n=1 Tax=Frateuria sp. TaxID=2211372 RepID=UPI002D7F959E|nr:hypothetical protein [Frateuria sp.]HET6803997.1 hypothetical protein [Frateuria sp.]
MSKMKSERHHWWPQCVSERWTDTTGGVHWLLPTGEERHARPASFGVIGNGHFIKLGRQPGQSTSWDQNFEPVFQQADDRFPAVIDWLESLAFEPRMGQPKRERYLPQISSDKLFGHMVESLTSLAVRSPMTRETCVSLAEHLRGRLPERERNSLIALNLRDIHTRAVKAFGVSGKAAAILSPDREFVFGDGFFHNLNSLTGPPSQPRILAPLTPRLAVLYAIPMRYRDEPRLSTLLIDAGEADVLNQVVQIYARQALFYRSERPRVTDEFRASQHRRFIAPGHVVDEMIHAMPGVPDRDTTFDLFSSPA